MSGSECVVVLEQLGFRAHRRANGLATLRRGGRVVLVPDSATLSPAVVGAILRAADVDALVFLTAFERLGPEPPESTHAVA